MFEVKFSPLKFSLEGFFFLRSFTVFFDVFSRGIKALSWIRSDNGRSLSVIMFHISVFLCVKVR